MLANLPEIEPKFKEGGFFRYDLNDRLSVLALNTIYFSVKNSQDLGTATSQLAWLESELSGASPGRRFLISMHIPPMLFYYQALDDFWKETFKTEFLRIISAYQSKIIMVLGAHIHQADIRAPYSATYPDLSLPMFLTPSVSPIFLNNPGYSILDLNLQANSRLDTVK
jgi:hypothetical protein